MKKIKLILIVGLVAAMMIATLSLFGCKAGAAETTTAATTAAATTAAGKAVKVGDSIGVIGSPGL